MSATESTNQNITIRLDRRTLRRAKVLPPVGAHRLASSLRLAIERSARRLGRLSAPTSSTCLAAGVLAAAARSFAPTTGDGERRSCSRTEGSRSGSRIASSITGLGLVGYILCRHS
jgi:hypothetical protein